MAIIVKSSSPIICIAYCQNRCSCSLHATIKNVLFSRLLEALSIICLRVTSIHVVIILSICSWELSHFTPWRCGSSTDIGICSLTCYAALALILINITVDLVFYFWILILVKLVLILLFYAFHCMFISSF